MTSPQIHKRRAEVAARLLTGKMPEFFTFAMQTYGQIEPRDCGTAGCIAGLTVEMFYGHRRALKENESVSKLAEDILDLDGEEGAYLFEPGLHVTDIFLKMREITELQAGRVLARFHLHGLIDWDSRDTPIQIGDRTF